MTLKQLEAFYLAATLGGFALAAQRGHVTQSSLSKRIAELEGSVEAELFDRSSKRAQLTEAGHRLLPMAAQMLELKQGYPRRIEGPAHPGPHLPLRHQRARRPDLAAALRCPRAHRAPAAGAAAPCESRTAARAPGRARRAGELMVACARRVPWLDARMRAGHWDKDGYEGLELCGSTLGLIGMGSIGRRVAQVASALGQTVLVHDPYAKPEDLPSDATSVGLEGLLGRSDIVSLHCPLTANTRSLLDRQRLALLKPGAIVINTARAELIDEQALLEALHAGQVSAGLDCFIDEPQRPDAPLLRAPNVVLTPHIGGTTTALFRAMGIGAARHIRDVLD